MLALPFFLLGMAWQSWRQSRPTKAPSPPTGPEPSAQELPASAPLRAVLENSSILSAPPPLPELPASWEWKPAVTPGQFPEWLTFAATSQALELGEFTDSQNRRYRQFLISREAAAKAPVPPPPSPAPNLLLLLPVDPTPQPTAPVPAH